MFQSGDTLIDLNAPWPAIPRYWVRDEAGQLQYTRAVGGDPEGDDISLDFQAAAPALSDVFVKPRRGTPDRDDLYRLESMAGKLLSDGERPIEDVLDHLEKATGHPRLFVENCLRTLAAEQTLLAFETGKKKKVRLKLSDRAKRAEKGRAYASSFAHELAGQALRIGQLISHRATVGANREELLRVLIQRHIPQRFHAATGFIHGGDAQLDILIYDQIDYAPLFRAGDLVVVPPEAVRAIIEVKSGLHRDDLTDAMTHLIEALPVRKPEEPPIFTGVFGYDGAEVNTLLDAYVTFHDEGDANTAYGPETSFNLISGIDSTVTAICILQKVLLVPGFQEAKLGAQEAYVPVISGIRSFGDRQSEAALFFDLLSRYLRYPRHGAILAPSSAAALVSDTIREFSLPLRTNYWGPYILDCEAELWFEADLAAYRRWLAGEVWRPEPAGPHSADEPGP